MAEKFLLDTSAVMTLIEDEAGADRVEAVLNAEEALIPWTVLLEARYILLQEQSELEADKRYALIKSLPCTILWEVNEAIVLQAAQLKARHRISLADAIIAVFAKRYEAVLLHKDPEYEALAEYLPLEALPYKG